MFMYFVRCAISWILLTLCSDQTVQIYVSTGMSFSVPLPCQIKKLWNLESLLLLERCNNVEQSGPILLSLMHPLEGCKPVAVVVKPDSSLVNVSTDR